MEAARLAALRSLNVKATRQSLFQAIASCTAYACEAPVAAICFAGKTSLHIQASVGLPSGTLEVPRAHALCDTAIDTGNLIVEEAIDRNPAYCEHPAMRALGIRSGASIPIVLSSGIAIGTLFALDQRSRRFTETHRKALSGLRDEIVRLLEDRVTNDLRPEYVEVLESATSFTTNGIGVYVMRAGREFPDVEYVNRAIYDRAGVPADEYKADSRKFFSIANNRQLLDRSIEHARAADESSFDCQVQSAHGRDYWVEAQVHVLEPNAAGELRYMVITRDISERKSDESFRQLLTATVEKEPDAVFIIRMNGEAPLWPEIVYANDGYYKLTGYSRNDVENGPYPVLLGAESDLAVIDRCVQRVLAGQAVRDEVRLYRKDGTAFWAEVHAHPLDSPAEHCVLILRDVTASHDQREQFRLISAALEQAADFIVITDTTSPALGGPHIVFVNKSVLEATGFDESEVIGRSWTELLSPKNDPRVWPDMAGRVERSEPNYKEFMIQRADGTDFWVEFVGRPFHGGHNDKRYRIAIGRDITLRKRAADQISLLFAAIEESRDPTVIYERNPTGDLVPVYENARAQRLGRHRLLHLLQNSERGAALAKFLLSGEEARQIFADLRPDGTPAVVEFSARALQGRDRIEAAITVERTLAQGDPKSSSGYRSRLLNVSTMLPAIAEATSTTERFAILRALLLDTFGAEVSTGESSESARVFIDAGSRKATFTYAGLQRTAHWPHTLEDTAITALRFCIEAAIEHEEERAGTRF